MRTIILLLCLFVCFIFPAFSQTTYTLADTAYANRLLNESEVLFNRREYDSASIKADSSLIIFEQALGKETKEVANVLLLKSLIFHYRFIKTDEAVVIAEKALAIRIKLNGENHIEVAKAHERIGQIYNTLSYHKKALLSFEKAIEIREFIGDESLETATCYVYAANIYAQQLIPEKSIQYCKKALDIRIRELGENHILVAHIYNLLSKTHYLINDANTSLKYYEIAKRIYFKRNNKIDGNIVFMNRYVADLYLSIEDGDKALSTIYESLNIGKSQYLFAWVMSYMNLIFYYDWKGDYDKALEVGQRSLEIITESKISQLCWAHITLGIIYFSMKNYDKSIEHYDEAIEIEKKKVGEIEKLIALSYLGLGRAYQKKGNYDLAIINNHKALYVYSKLFDSTSYYFGWGGYNALAECYENMEKYDSAKYYRQKMLTCHIPKDQETVCQRAFANIAEKQHDYESAGVYFEKAFMTLNFTNIEQIANVFSLPELITTLADKASFERRWYLVSGNINQLNASVETYQQALAALNYQNRQFNSEGIKAEQKKKRFALYEGMIETILLLKTQRGSKDAFSFNEQSKASLLQSRLKESDALHFANIPDSLLKREKDLRLDITAYEKSRQQRMNEGKSETDSLNIVLTLRADSLRQLYASLKLQFEQNYPEYYRLKYDLNTVNVAEVQEKLLSPEQTMLSYFVGDSAVYAFVVRRDTFAVFNFKKDFPLESWVKQLRDGLYGYHTAAVKPEKLYEMKADSFAQAAYHIHEKILAPLSHLLTKEVIIIPDGVLGYVPFDALLSEMPKEATNFNRHAYFGKKHIVSYNYSATLWQEMSNKKHKTEPTKNFIGFAPYYNGDTVLLSNLFSHDLTMRKGLDSLKNSGEEVYKAQQLMGGESILDKKATKETFETLAGDYRIVRVATKICLTQRLLYIKTKLSRLILPIKCPIPHK